MPRMFPLVVASLLAAAAQAACPNSGVEESGRCWYLGDMGKSCSATCTAQGLQYSHFLTSEDSTMTPKLLGKAPGTKQFAWGRTECYVPDDDRYHTAKAIPNGDTGDSGEPGDWSVSVCRLACSCVGGPDLPELGAPTEPYPACVRQDVVLRHAGAHAIFADFKLLGASGCWQNDCANTDKFNAIDMGICARACAQSEECTHWSFGEQEGTRKCFLRKSDGGRETAQGWHSASKACAPAVLPDAYVAQQAAELLKVCDAGKSDACPDMARAINTWKFAIKHLKVAADGRLDAATQQFINQVSGDTESFSSQMSEENFPVVVANNRQVFQALAGWLQGQPAPAIDPNDASLPSPVRGKLCGPTACYDEL